MKRILSLIVSLILTLGLLAACGSNESGNTAGTDPPTEAASVAPAVTDEMRAELKEAFETVFAQRLYEGAAYVVYQGEEVYAGGAGKANKAEGTDNGAEVVYRIGSVTKQFTAAAILRLCEQGRLSLDDTLEKYYPAYTTGKDVTLSHLLSMQSGIRDYLRSYDDEGREISSTSEPFIAGAAESNSIEANRDALLQHIFSMELLYPQGEGYNYSNSNYVLLGGIVEQVSGVSFHEYIRTNFFEPLGMDTAGFIDEYDNPGATVAKGYNKASNASLVFAYPGIAFACGDIMASPKDLYKWTIALHTGKVLGGEMYGEMTAIHVGDPTESTCYGYGLMIAEINGVRMIFHSGSIPGFISFVAYIPDQDCFIALMNNHGSESTSAIAVKLLEILGEKLTEAAADSFIKKQDI